MGQSPARPYIYEPARRRYRGKICVVRGTDDIVRICRSIRRHMREHFLVVLLNTRNELIGVETVAIGCLNASVIHPREVFRPAIVGSAARVILLHNHPSGEPEPSQWDIALTKRLIESGELLGIDVLDHVIMARRGVVSFKARKLIPDKPSAEAATVPELAGAVPRARRS